MFYSNSQTLTPEQLTTNHGCEVGVLIDSRNAPEYDEIEDLIRCKIEQFVSELWWDEINAYRHPADFEFYLTQMITANRHYFEQQYGSVVIEKMLLELPAVSVPKIATGTSIWDTSRDLGYRFSRQVYLEWCKMNGAGVDETISEG